MTGSAPDRELSAWIAELPDPTHKQLSQAGILGARQSSTLGRFLDDYIERRSDVKPNTVRKWKTTRRYLSEFFGQNRNLREITLGDADRFRSELYGKGHAENTVRKHIAESKTFFNAAVRSGLIDENPFADQASTIQANPERFHFVTRETIEKVIDACPDAEWLLIVALARFGGLRIPSEALALQWSDIDWENDRIRVPSPKTEHHDGKASRTIPLFPELKPYLEDAFELAKDGAIQVITRYHNASQNLGTMFVRIIGRAGVDRWPKVFQNLRSSRETELAETFPLHVVTTWIGNTEAVAAKHYLQVTSEHFHRAVSGAYLVQQGAANGRNADSPKTTKPAMLGIASDCDCLHVSQVAEEGLEPPTRGL